VLIKLPASVDFSDEEHAAAMVAVRKSIADDKIPAFAAPGALKICLAKLDPAIVA
jgi:hypothetical protein